MANHLGELLTPLIDGELDPDERDRALAHLAGCEQCRAEAAAQRRLKARLRSLSLDSPASSLLDRLLATTAIKRGEPARIQQYRLLGRLGAGGTGVVYLGADPEARSVAIKVLRPQIAGDAMARRRLARQVDAMRQVRSPHVAAVLDADVTTDQPYFVTEYVPGRSLQETVEKHGPIRGQRLQRLAAGLASAVSEIHRAGMVHGDLKPGNVLLTDSEPVLVDFGIAQMVDVNRLTATGMAMWTGYLAPEIIEGEDVGPASDVYAWASTVTYAATGRPPFPSETIESTSHEILHGPPDLDGLAQEFAPLVRSAMARHPADRPTAVNLARFTQRVGSRRPAPSPRTAGSSLGSPAIRAQAVAENPHPLTKRSRPAKDRRHADEIGAARRLLDQGRYALAEEALRRVVIAHPQSVVAHNNLAAALHGTGRPAEAELELERALELCGPAGLTGTRIRTNIAAVQHDLGDLGSLARFQSCLDETPDAVHSRGNLAVALHREGRLEEARQEAEAALAKARRSLGRRSRTTLVIEANLAAILRDLGRTKDAEKRFRKTLKRTSRVMGRVHPQTLTVLAGLAAVLDDLGRSAEAADVLRRVVEARTTTLGSSHPATVRARTSLAVLVHQAGGPVDDHEVDS